MLALVYHGPGKMKLEERPVPVPKDNEVLVKMKAVAVCGSDLGAYRLSEISERWMPPLVFGHEFAGVIEDCGKDATKYKKGTRVTANPILYCGKCFYCKRGDINYCTSRNSFGTSIGGKTTDGAMQEYFTIREEAIIPLLDGISDEEGAFLEPLACCYNSAKRGSFGEGERVLVTGAGPIGLMNVKFLKAMGAENIIVSDMVDVRLDYAKKYGAHNVINVDRQNLRDEIKRLTDGIGVDRVIITSGNHDAIPESLAMVRSGGNSVLVTITHYKVEIDPLLLVGRDVGLLGSYMFKWEQKDVMNMIAEGKLEVKDLITSTCKISESEDVFAKLAAPGCKDVKILITA